MAVYHRTPDDPIYMRKLGSAHIVMYNPHLAKNPQYIFGWTFEDLLPRGIGIGDLKPSQIIRPPALGGKNIGAIRIKEKEQAKAAELVKREELRLIAEQEAQENIRKITENAEAPSPFERVPDESPENWRNWSRQKLIKYAKDSLGVTIHHATGRDNVVKKIEEALHYVEPEPEVEIA